MAFENLTVKLGADTAGFTGPMEAAKSQTESLADGLGQLARRASRADDAIEEAGDSAARTSGTFSVLSAGTSGLSLSFGALTSSVVTVTAAFTALLAVLTPAVAALSGFAAIAGAIGLTGLTGGILAATQRTETLKRQLRLTADAITTAFAPVTEEATRVIVALLSQFRPLISELAPAESQITAIGDAFQTLGENVIAAIPPLVDAATQLTAQFLPSVADSSTGLADMAKNIRDLVTSERFSNFISNTIAAAKELAPEIKQIGENLAGLTDKETLKGLTTLVDGLLDILVVITGILDKLDPLFAGLSKVFSTFGGVGQSSLAAAGDADSGNIGNIVPSVAEGGAQNPYANAQRGSTISAGEATRRYGPQAAPPVGGVRVNVEGDTEVVRNVSAEVADERIDQRETQRYQDYSS